MKILGYEWTLENKLSVEQIGSSGKMIMANQLILIATNQCEEQKISTVLHEIIEVLNYSFNLKLNHNQIFSLESGLYQTLKDNGIDLQPLLNDLNPKTKIEFKTGL